MHDAPALETYTDLVDRHLERLYRFLVLMIGERDLAEADTLAAYRRVWTDLQAGNVFGDAEEILYRTATRSALRRRQRGSVRGHLPPTTAEDRLITATGIISEFIPQQQAAIYLAVWGGVGYELAGAASGVGTARARDLAFAARQAYRTERDSPEDMAPLCATIAPLLAGQDDNDATPADEARIDEHLAECPVCPQTARVYDEFGSLLKSIRLPLLPESLETAVRDEPQAQRRRRPGGWRRLVRLAAGPAILTVVLIVGLFAFQAFTGEATIRTGAGRTSDVIYSKPASGNDFVIVESGSGRRLGNLPAGVMSADGRQLYSSRATCPASGCTTTLDMTDTATLQTETVGRIPGQLRVAAVDVDQAGQVYLADEATGWDQLVVYGLSPRQVRGTIAAPRSGERAFQPETAVLSGDRSTLFTVGSQADGSPEVVTTDLPTMRVQGVVPMPPPGDGGIELATGPGSNRVFAYETATGRLHEVDPAAGSILATADLGGRATADRPPPGGANPEGTIAIGPDGLLSAVVRTGGIGVVDPERMELVRRLNADRDYNTVSVSSDGRFVYAVDSAGAYVVMDPVNGNIVLRRPDAGIASLFQVNRGE